MRKRKVALRRRGFGRDKAHSFRYRSGVNGKQFMRRSRKWAKAHDLPERVESDEGKGRHVVQYVGPRKTVVKSGEIQTACFKPC